MPDLSDRSSKRTDTGGRKAEWTRLRILFQELVFQVYIQEIGHRCQPGNDISHLAAHICGFSTPIGPGEFPHFLQEPKEGFIRSAPCIAGQVYFADQIIIYRKPLERISLNFQELKENIRQTVVHEVGHYFGLDEEELRRLEERD